MSRDDRGPARSLGEQLTDVHRTLRERLAALRQEIADGAARPGLPGDLPGHCLSFCGAGRYLWSQKLTGFHAAHSVTTLLSGMPGMSMRRVCGVEFRAFLGRVVSCRQ